MAVVSYLVKENEGLISAPEEWQAKVTELGLAGQGSLMENGEKSPVPFMRMTEGHVRLFRALCPTATEVTEFGAEPIPMEALGLLGLAMKEKYFEEIEVWWCKGEPQLDPVLVGRRGRKDSRAEERYLIAQWGEEDMSFPRLAQRAGERLRRRAELTLKKDIADAQRKLEELDQIVARFLEGLGNTWEYNDLGWRGE
jgi:hypothetical protein